MLGNPDYNADAYDIACRVPGCPFEMENLSPTLAAMNLVQHINGPCTLRTEPVYTMRIRSGFEGTDPDDPFRTAAYGWFRPTVPWDQIEQSPQEWRAEKEHLLYPNR